MKTEESDNVILVVLPTSRPCMAQDCPTLTHYGISMDGKPFEPRCRKHLPENIIQEYWTQRLLNAALTRDEQRIRTCLRHITTEARLNGYERCASIADVKAQEARHSTYSNQDTAKGAEDMARRIGQSIRLAEE